MTGHDGGRDDAPRGDDAPRRPDGVDQADEAAGISRDGLTDDELRWVAGGTKPTEDEPFLPG